MKKLLATAAMSLAVLGTGAANAAFLDFTSQETADLATTNPFVLNVDGVLVSVLSAPVAGNFNDTVDTTSTFCQAQGGMFACDNDGLGIRDDEVGSNESVTLTFSEAVNIISLSFLDLFINPNDSSDDETVMVMVNGGLATTLDALVTFEPGGTGFATFAQDLGLVTSLSFMVGDGNDSIGIADFALAGIEFAPVPVPAAGLLFGSAILGGAAARRRRKVA